MSMTDIMAINALAGALGSTRLCKFQASHSFPWGMPRKTTMVSPVTKDDKVL